MTFFDIVTSHLQDPSVSAIIMEGELEPAGGPNQAIAPPTYARSQGDPSKDPNFAYSPESRIPQRSDSGWFHDFERIDGVPRLSGRVVINSIGACSRQAGMATYRQQGRLKVELPAFIITGPDGEAVASVIKSSSTSSPAIHEQIRQALDVRVSHWELAHRTADSWLQFADDGGGQIWAQDRSEIKEILLNISHERGDLVYEFAPDVAPYGLWLSSGTARRHAIPRAYSCEITGYGAKDVQRGSTKLDAMGGTSVKGSKIVVSQDGIKTGTKGSDPSSVGFGQVPTHVAVRGYTCELILRQASISLKALDRFTYPGGTEQAFAAKRVFVLLAMAGHLLASEDSFLRSSCDLVTVEEKWGWRRHGERVPESLSVPSLHEIGTALRKAVAEAEELGLRFAAPREVVLSPAQVELIADRVVIESTKFSQE